MIWKHVFIEHEQSEEMTVTSLDTEMCFDVLLTVHLSIILVIKQLNAQILVL